MDKIMNWIRQHQITAFFLLGITICFGTLFPALLLIPQESTSGQILSFYLAKIAVYSPVLTGMFISRISNPKRQRTRVARRLLVFLIVWIVAEAILTASLRLTASPDISTIVLVVLSLPAALLPALVITSAYFGADGVKNMLRTLIRPRGNLGYYLIALLAFPVIQIAGMGITNLLNGGAVLPRVNQVADLATTWIITFLSVLIFSGGINEESGWRGFTQKRLQAQYSPLVANLILWFLMVIWHIPNDIVQYQNGGYVLVRFGLYPFITILFGWIYNRTKGSILAPALFHASMNAMNPLMAIFPITAAGSILLVGFAIIALVSDRMWYRLPGEHPAVYQGVVTSDTAPRNGAEQDDLLFQPVAES